MRVEPRHRRHLVHCPSDRPARGHARRGVSGQATKAPPSPPRALRTAAAVDCIHRLHKRVRWVRGRPKVGHACGMASALRRRSGLAVLHISEPFPVGSVIRPCASAMGLPRNRTVEVTTPSTEVDHGPGAAPAAAGRRRLTRRSSPRAGTVLPTSGCDVRTSGSNRNSSDVSAAPFATWPHQRIRTACLAAYVDAKRHQHQRRQHDPRPRARARSHRVDCRLAAQHGDDSVRRRLAHVHRDLHGEQLDRWHRHRCRDPHFRRGRCCRRRRTRWPCARSFSLRSPFFPRRCCRRCRRCLRVRRAVSHGVGVDRPFWSVSIVGHSATDAADAAGFARPSSSSRLAPHVVCTSDGCGRRGPFAYARIAALRWRVRPAFTPRHTKRFGRDLECSRMFFGGWRRGCGGTRARWSDARSSPRR